jgi:hypothetical protein
LHLGGVGELRHGGDEEERRENVVRRGCLAMAPGEDFIGPVSGGRAHEARIYASPCSEATARCAAGQSCCRCSYSASHGPSRRPPPLGQGLDRVCRMKTCVGPDEKKCMEGATG